MKPRNEAFLFTLAVIIAVVCISTLTLSGCAAVPQKVTPAPPTEVQLPKFETAPVALFGLYSCQGWVGALVVLGNGDSTILSVTPGEAQKLADINHLPAGHTNHLFPAQGDCGGETHEAPYQKQAPHGDTLTL